MNIVIGIVLLLFGVWVLYAASTDADSLMASRRARSTVALFGRDGARVIYGLLGIMWIGIGILAFVKA